MKQGLGISSKDSLYNARDEIVTLRYLRKNALLSRSLRLILPVKERQLKRVSRMCPEHRYHIFSNFPVSGTVVSTTAESNLEAGKRIKLSAQKLSGSRVQAAEKPTSNVNDDLCFALMKEADFFLPKLRAKLGTQRM